MSQSPEIWFYHLTKSPLEKALPKLLEKALDKEMLSIVRSQSEEMMDHLNQELWTYSEESFLPHGSQKEPNPDEQFIYLTTSEENPNGAKLLVCVEGAQPESMEGYGRVIYMFDGRDDAAVQKARSYWKELKTANHTLAYWQQNDNGGWEKAA